jgi:leucyl-tRNA synthetase
LHLLYARFWHKVLYDAGFVSTKEPFQQLFNQGLLLAHSYRDDSGKYYYHHQVEEQDGRWVVKETGKPVHTQLEKMSKSRFNIHSLDDVVDEYGADALRLYEIFIGPLSASGPWQTNGIEGVQRFLQRVWRLMVDEKTGGPSSKLTTSPARTELELLRLLHKTIRRVTDAVESLDKMNTAVSQLMTFANAATQAATLPAEIASTFVRLLAPFAPHISEELWPRLGETQTLAYAPWPTFDAALAADDMISIAIQVNGKLRGVVEAPAEATAEAIEAYAQEHAGVRHALKGQKIQKVIVAPGRLVNFLTSR